MILEWPERLVAGVRAVKHGMVSISAHAVGGVPLDIPARVLVLGLLFFCLRMRVRARGAATICVLLLLCTELFEVVAVRDSNKLIPPDRRDLVDLASGLAGIALARSLERTRRLIVPLFAGKAPCCDCELQTKPAVDGYLAAGLEPHRSGLEKPE